MALATVNIDKIIKVTSTSSYVFNFYGLRRRKVASPCVEIGLSSGVEIQTISLHTISINSRFSSYVAPWAGPCSTSALSMQTVGRQALRGPASKEVERKETFPSPESPMADDGGSTNSSLTGCVPPSVTSRGGVFVVLIRVRDRVSIVPSRYLTDWVCVAEN